MPGLPHADARERARIGAGILLMLLAIRDFRRTCGRA
jgi:hypothetical protein